MYVLCRIVLFVSVIFYIAGNAASDQTGACVKKCGKAMTAAESVNECQITCMLVGTDKTAKSADDCNTKCMQKGTKSRGSMAVCMKECQSKVAAAVSEKHDEGR